MDKNISNDKLINELNGVIVKNYDAAKGFQNAVDNVNDSSLKRIFADCSNQRSTFAGELQSEVRTLGGEPKSESSTLGAMHRGWMDIKTALSSDKAESVLEACVTGEKAAVAEYDDILNQEIPSNVKNVLEKQRTQVNNSLQQMSALENIVD